MAARLLGEGDPHAPLVAAPGRAADEARVPEAGEGFFDAGNHPEITFAVRGADRLDADGGRVTGSLTVRGVTEPQALTPRLLPADADALTLETCFDAHRAQSGLGWNQLGMMRGLTTVTASLRFTRGGADGTGIRGRGPGGPVPQAGGGLAAWSAARAGADRQVSHTGAAQPPRPSSPRRTSRVESVCGDPVKARSRSRVLGLAGTANRPPGAHSSTVAVPCAGIAAGPRTSGQ